MTPGDNQRQWHCQSWLLQAFCWARALFAELYSFVCCLLEVMICSFGCCIACGLFAYFILKLIYCTTTDPKGWIDMLGGVKRIHQGKQRKVEDGWKALQTTQNLQKIPAKDHKHQDKLLKSHFSQDFFWCLMLCAVCRKAQVRHVELMLTSLVERFLRLVAVGSTGTKRKVKHLVQRINQWVF